jgi:hypothetical protein
MNKQQYYNSDCGPVAKSDMWLMVINYTEAEIEIDYHAGTPQLCRTFTEICSYLLVRERADFTLNLEKQGIINLSDKLRDKVKDWSSQTNASQKSIIY